jgi:hypothetical protein
MIRLNPDEYSKYEIELVELKEYKKTFMQGYKTWTGLIVTLLGYAGLAQYFGGVDEATKFVDSLLQLIGMVIAIYGNYKSHQRIAELSEE